MFFSLNVAFVVAKLVRGHPPLPTENGGATIVEEAGGGSEIIYTCSSCSPYRSSLNTIRCACAKPPGEKWAPAGAKEAWITISVAEGRRNGIKFISTTIPKRRVCPVVCERVARLRYVGLRTGNNDGAVRGF